MSSGGRERKVNVGSTQLADATWSDQVKQVTRVGDWSVQYHFMNSKMVASCRTTCQAWVDFDVFPPPPPKCKGVKVGLVSFLNVLPPGLEWVWAAVEWGLLWKAKGVKGVHYKIRSAAVILREAVDQKAASVWGRGVRSESYYVQSTDLDDEKRFGPHSLETV